MGKFFLDLQYYEKCTVTDFHRSKRLEYQEEFIKEKMLNATSSFFFFYNKKEKLSFLLCIYLFFTYLDTRV